MSEVKKTTFVPDNLAFAVMGYDLSNPADVFFDPVNCVCRIAANEVERVSHELLLAREEWMAIADVMCGCANAFDRRLQDIGALTVIVGDLQESHETEEKWGIDVPDLCRRLGEFTAIEGEAILAAVRWFLSHGNEIDGAKDQWWRVDFRKRWSQKT